MKNVEKEILRRQAIVLLQQLADCKHKLKAAEDKLYNIAVCHLELQRAIDAGDIGAISNAANQNDEYLADVIVFPALQSESQMLNPVKSREIP